MPNQRGTYYLLMAFRYDDDTHGEGVLVTRRELARKIGWAAGVGEPTLDDGHIVAWEVLLPDDVDEKH